MHSTKLFLLFLCVSIFVLKGCNEGGISGEELDNEPPTTSLTVDNVNLPDGTLLSSRVALSWWGNDPDGYILRYEYAINDTSESAWRTTFQTDSIFTLPIAPGQAADTVLFKVRAVDNNGARDPIGASISLPVKNTVPSISFNSNQLPPDTTYGITSFGWTVVDQDGLVSLSSVEIAFNDSLDENNWTSIPLENIDEDGRTFVTLIIDGTTVGPTTADVKIGTNLSTPNTPLEFRNIIPEQDNKAFIRVTDNSGAVSEIVSHTWFVKRQTSRVLFLNDDDSRDSDDNQIFHLNLLAANGIIPDVLNITDGEAAAGQKVRISEAFPGNLETARTDLAQWDYIYWMSNNIDRNITFAQSLTTDFLDQGGSLLVIIPSKIIGSGDEVFNFLPVGDVGKVEGIQTSFRLLRNSAVTPIDPTLPELQITRTMSTVAPMQAVAGAEVLYTADFRVQIITGQIIDYTGFEDVVIKSGEGNLIYVALELTDLDGNNNVSELINELGIQELGFQQ